MPEIDWFGLAVGIVRNAQRAQALEKIINPCEECGKEIYLGPTGQTESGFIPLVCAACYFLPYANGERPPGYEEWLAGGGR